MKKEILIIGGAGLLAAAYFLSHGGGETLDYGGGGAPVFGKLTGNPVPQQPVTVYQFPPQPAVNFPQPQLWNPQTVLTPQVAQNQKKTMMKEVAKSMLPAPVKTALSVAEPVGYQSSLSKTPKISVKKAEKMGLIKFDQPDQPPQKSAFEMITQPVSGSTLSKAKKGTTGGGKIKTGTVSTSQAKQTGIIKFDQPKKKHTTHHTVGGATKARMRSASSRKRIRIASHMSPGEY